MWDAAGWASHIVVVIVGDDNIGDKMGLIAVIPHVENGGCMEMEGISDLEQAVEMMLVSGRGGSSRAINDHIVVILTLSVTYWGVESTLKWMLSSLPSLEIGDPILLPCSLLHALQHVLFPLHQSPTFLYIPQMFSDSSQPSCYRRHCHPIHLHHCPRC